ncbi:MAG: hypothetical protein ACR2PZ_14025 [Pseudomonadales bacterium]
MSRLSVATDKFGQHDQITLGYSDIVEKVCEIGIKITCAGGWLSQHNF